VAAENAKRNAVNVQLKKQDVFAPVASKNQYDIIVSNPPYVLEAEKMEMAENVLGFEPHIALFVPNKNPLLFYEHIADIAKKLLKPGGKLYFEINREKGDAVSTMMREKGFVDVEVRKDMSGNERMVRAKSKKITEKIYLPPPY